MATSKNTAGVYHYEITVVAGCQYLRRETYRATQKGKPLRGGVDDDRKTISMARFDAHLHFHKEAQVETDFEEWEALQTFHEKLIYPPGCAKKLELALDARKKAEAAAKQASEATREAVNAFLDIGMTYSAIGELLGLTKMRVCQIVRGE
jgi:hypothetical protein